MSKAILLRIVCEYIAYISCEASVSENFIKHFRIYCNLFL